MVYTQETSFPWDNPETWEPTTMASDLHWERSGMEAGFVEAEHDRLNLEWHMASVNNVAESLQTDGGATAAGAANRAGANANEEGAEELAQAQAPIRRNRIPREQYVELQQEGENKHNIRDGENLS